MKSKNVQKNSQEDYITRKVVWEIWHHRNAGNTKNLRAWHLNISSGLRCNVVILRLMTRPLCGRQNCIHVFTRIIFHCRFFRRTAAADPEAPSREGNRSWLRDGEFCRAKSKRRKQIQIPTAKFPPEASLFLYKVITINFRWKFADCLN